MIKLRFHRVKQTFWGFFLVLICVFPDTGNVSNSFAHPETEMLALPDFLEQLTHGCGFYITANQEVQDVSILLQGTLSDLSVALCLL